MRGFGSNLLALQKIRFCFALLIPTLFPHLLVLHLLLYFSIAGLSPSAIAFACALHCSVFACLVWPKTTALRSARERRPGGDKGSTSGHRKAVNHTTNGDGWRWMEMDGVGSVQRLGAEEFIAMLDYGRVNTCCTSRHLCWHLYLKSIIVSSGTFIKLAVQPG